MRLAMSSLVMLFVLAVPAAAGDRPPFSDAEYWAGIWDDQARDEWQKPLAILQLLGIDRGDTVADLGAGTGYLTGYLAIQVGAEGKVYAVDVEPELLEHIRSREEIAQDRIETLLAERNDPLLPQDAIDLIVTVNTWHHIKSRSRYLKKLSESLKPEGRMVVIDFRQKDLPVGPQEPRHKVSRDKVVSEFERAGWTLQSESIALPYQYMLTFSPPRKFPRRPFVRSWDEPLDP